MSDSEDGKLPRGKTQLEGARVFIHVPHPNDRATVTHIDVSHPVIARILDDEKTHFGPTNCGGFIGLKKEMIPRAQREAAAIRRGVEWRQCSECGAGWLASENHSYCPECGEEQHDPFGELEA